MADTIITNTPDKSDGGAGWFVALILIIALAVGGVILYKKGAFRSAPASGTNINVTIPAVNNPTEGAQE